MNRIILIGNGFDLAHNIKSSYSHFITNYWREIIQKLRSKVNGNITTYLEVFENDEIIIKNIPGGAYNAGDWVQANTYEDLVKILTERNLGIRFKNKFLNILSEKYKERNWVDIENEYYTLLKESFKKKTAFYKIEALNQDLNNVKKLLELYLSEIEQGFLAIFGKSRTDEKLKQNIGSKIYSPFELKDFSEISINRRAELEFQNFHKEIKTLNDKSISDLDENSKKILSAIGKDATLKDIRKLLMSNNAGNYFDLIPEEILFLNFNYTFTEKIYSNQNEFVSFDSRKEILKRYIQIHGTTNKYDNNDVIFGFGDEIDEDYKSIENLNDNNYLENIKSIKYLETDNYKRLLEFLNTGEYQIFIFGHSCGISDRTLLNTLFEHKNCSSIKPFYYQTEKGNDNYSDIVRNISRNFNSKANMRDKVVNKKYCEPLSENPST